MPASEDYPIVDPKTHLSMCNEIDWLREYVYRLRLELGKWGWGDFHYGPQQQEQSIRELMSEDPLACRRIGL